MPDDGDRDVKREAYSGNLEIWYFGEVVIKEVRITILITIFPS